MDIVERLRDCALQKFTQNGEEFHLRFCNDAAAEIERLREALKKIAALENAAGLHTNLSRQATETARAALKGDE